MFCIKTVESISGNTAKTHFASNREVAEEVLYDLNMRFDKMKMEEILENEVFWDPGGILMTDDEIFKLNLGSMVVCCRAQHFDYLYHRIEKYSIRGTKTKYYKIHSNWTCFCITPEEFENLKNLVNDPILKNKATQSVEEKERRLNSLADGGHLIRATKDDNGNIVDINKLRKNDKGLN